MASPKPNEALGNLPDGLREEVVTAFNKVLRKYRRRDWEGAEQAAGKFCEIVYTILRGRADGSYPDKASKPRNFPQACRNLENETHLPRALRIQIPRVLPGIYEIRNNRNVGHVGGDVDPSHMDAAYVVAACRWIMGDLVRAFHDLRPEEATEVVEGLVEREIPLVWENGNTKRVLDTSLKTDKQVLVLLETELGPVDVDSLLDWTEYKNPSRFRTRVLAKLHRSKMVEYDKDDDTVEILPPGSQEAEAVLAGRLAP